MLAVYAQNSCWLFDKHACWLCTDMLHPLHNTHNGMHAAESRQHDILHNQICKFADNDDLLNPGLTAR